MAKYEVSEPAKDDLERIWFYGLERWGRLAARKYTTSLHRRFALLAEKPYLYPVARPPHQAYRQSVCGSETIYYRITDDGVEIMAVLGRQNRDGRL